MALGAALLRQSATWFALLVLGLAAYLFAGTSLTHNRAQASLRREYREQAAAFKLPPVFSQNGDGSLGKPQPIATGSPVAWMRIPSLGITEVVVEGSNASQTVRGPGHVRPTPLPGQFGNSVVVCRRTTGGAPCADLNQLKVGEDISFSTAFGDVTYRVFATGAAPARDARLFNTLKSGPGSNAHTINSLTLVTSDPAIVSSRRFVVQAELIGTAKNFTPSRFQVRADELGLSGESNAWLPLLLALQLLLASALGAAWLVRRWNPRAAWIVSVPVVLCAMWLVCEQFLRVLPGAL